MFSKKKKSKEELLLEKKLAEYIHQQTYLLNLEARLIMEDTRADVERAVNETRENIPSIVAKRLKEDLQEREENRAKIKQSISNSLFLIKGELLKERSLLNLFKRDKK